MAMIPGKPGPDPIDVRVGLRIRQLRRERRMSQAALGEHLGITFQQIQKYERGTNRISASMIYRTAKAFGVQPGDILPRTDAAPLPEPTALIASLRGAEDVLTGYAAITAPRHRRAVLTLIRALADSDDVAESER